MSLECLTMSRIYTNIYPGPRVASCGWKGMSVKLHRPHLLCTHPETTRGLVCQNSLSNCHLSQGTPCVCRRTILIKSLGELPIHPSNADFLIFFFFHNQRSLFCLQPSLEKGTHKSARLRFCRYRERQFLLRRSFANGVPFWFHKAEGASARCSV